MTVEEKQELFIGPARQHVAHKTLQKGSQLGITAGNLCKEPQPQKTGRFRVIFHRADTGNQVLTAVFTVALHLEVNHTVFDTNEHRVGVQFHRANLHLRFDQLDHRLHESQVMQAIGIGNLVRSTLTDILVIGCDHYLTFGKHRSGSPLGKLQHLHSGRNPAVLYPLDKRIGFTDIPQIGSVETGHTVGITGIVEAFRPTGTRQ